MFYIIILLTYFHIKILVRVKQKMSYLRSSWTRTILAVKSIKQLYH